MLLLTSTSDQIRIVTSAAVSNIQVHASYIDLDTSGTVTPGRKNTVISTATTTSIVASPAASTFRTVKLITVRNTSTTAGSTVEFSHTDGTTPVVLHRGYLGPLSQVQYTEDTGFISISSYDAPTTPWAGAVITTTMNGNPNDALINMQRAGNIAPTPTNISTSVARCETFRPAFAINPNRLRFYGIGATTAVYQAAIYRWSDLARVTAQLALTTVAGSWGSADVTGLTLAANELYFIAVSANATGTTAGLGSVGSTVTSTTGQIATVPTGLPGNMNFSQPYLNSYRFQFAVTTGALPTTAPALVAQSAWTGGMPVFWLDTDNAA